MEVRAAGGGAVRQFFDTGVEGIMADRALTVTLNGLAARLKHLAEVLRRANKLRVYCKEFLFFANKELYRLASESA